MCRVLIDLWGPRAPIHFATTQSILHRSGLDGGSWPQTDRWNLVLCPDTQGRKAHTVFGHHLGRCCPEPLLAHIQRRGQTENAWVRRFLQEWKGSSCQQECAAYVDIVLQIVAFHIDLVCWL